MKVLFTSDWQASYENLDTLQVVVDEILALKERLGFDVLVHCGDVKHAYNPVDVRVVNFILRAFNKFQKAGLDCYVDLGNHDRVGMHVDKQNWFPILRKAGVVAVDDPRVIELDTFQLHLLPFRTDPVLLQREAQDLAAKASPEKSVLVFHNELYNCKFNVLSRGSGKLKVEDLVPLRYMVCIGGHIHLPQRVSENVYYVGSPFAGDWGEANQKKGYLLLDFRTKRLTRVPSRIPGWYDPQWPRFEDSKPSSWRGARVRIKVPIADSRQVTQELRRAKEKASHIYQEAEILVIPEFVATVGGVGQGIQTSWTDKKKIEKYVEETLPRPLEPYRQKTIAYLVSELEQAGGIVREGGELKFKKVHAENFLSFKKIDWVLRPGLHVVTGKNKDWNRSNGAGKTSWLQPIAVALFGRTFKEQKHDHWVRRGTPKEEPAMATVSFLDSQDRVTCVGRSRQPKVQLRIWVDGNFVDSGNRPDQTQKAIEQITGYTWETLSNAVYIDQSRAHLMLTGTEKERKEFLARLQNLERFEFAKKRIKDRKMGLEATARDLEDEIGTAQELASSLEQTILQTQKLRRPNSSPEAAFRLAETELREVKESLSAWHLLANRKRSAILTVAEKQQLLLEKLLSGKSTLFASIVDSQDRITSFRNLGLVAKCPTCEAEVDRNRIEKQVLALEKFWALKKESHQQKAEQIFKLKALKYRTEARLHAWDRNPSLESLVEEKGLALARAKVERDQAEREATLLDNLRRRRQDALKKATEREEKLKKVQRWLGILDYGEQVFSRSGLPAYLNAQIVPELNQAASEYAELFSQKEIQVLFRVDTEGQMDVQIVNAHGGEEIHDQSNGEMKMASLITSFAVRQAAPKTNLLILDEPGDGLDPVSARQFARGLKELTVKFCTILCVTHNPSILSELGEEKTITIVKENGISRMEE